MKFSEFDKKNKKVAKSSKVEWVKNYDFNTCHLISEARLKSGLTQRQLADLVGTKQPSIARAESGSVLPGHNLLKKIALAIGATLIPSKFNFMETSPQTIVVTKIEEKIKPYYIVGVESNCSHTKEALNAKQIIS